MKIDVSEDRIISSTVPRRLICNRLYQLQDHHSADNIISEEEMLLHFPHPQEPLGFKVSEGVFSPSFGEGSMLISSYLLATAATGKFCDMGTGSGIHGIYAARSCSEVLCIDVSAAACKCAKENIIANGIENKASVTRSDIFANIPTNQRFDMISFNTPFINAEPNNEFEKSIFDPKHKTLRRFVAQAPEFLQTGGTVLLAYSNIGDMNVIEKAIKGSSMSELAERSLYRRNGMEFYLSVLGRR